METIGFVGLGIMGRPMARNLLAAGHPLVVHSRSPGPVEALVADGARAAGSPRAVAEQVDVVITMLPDGPDLEAVVLREDGLLAGGRPGLLIVDMSTVAPGVAHTLADAVAHRGVAMVDAPVSGGERGAIDGTLSIMVGGAEPDVARAAPLLAILGSRTVHVGPAGAGQVAKACNQLVVASTIQAVAEALALARRAGVEPARVREALLGGFADSRVLDVHGQRMLDGAFAPGFRARLHRKDARIVEETAAASGATLPAFAVVAGQLDMLVASGGGELDHSALATLLGE